MTTPTAVTEGPDDAPLVVLVHGAPDRRGAFRRVQRLLPEYRTMTYDRRGYGESAWLEPARTLDDHARDLLDILDGRVAIVVGHSFGANVVLCASIMAPELFAAIGAWEPSMCWLPGWDVAHIEVVRDMATVADTDALGERMGVGFNGVERWNVFDGKTQALWRREGLAVALDMGFVLEAPYDLTEVSVPAVAGMGEQTTGYHFVGAQLLAAGLGVEPMIIPGVSHLAHSQNPTEWAGFVRRVIALGAG